MPPHQPVEICDPTHIRASQLVALSISSRKHWERAIGRSMPGWRRQQIQWVIDHVAYFVLQTAIVRSGQIDARVAQAFGRDAKGKLSIVAYAAGIALAFLSPWVSIAIFVVVALVWLIPDRRIELAMHKDDAGRRQLD